MDDETLRAEIQALATDQYHCGVRDGLRAAIEVVKTGYATGHPQVVLSALQDAVREQDGKLPVDERLG